MRISAHTSELEERWGARCDITWLVCVSACPHGGKGRPTSNSLMPAVVGDGAAGAHPAEVSIYGWRAVRYAQVLMKILWVGPQFLHPTTKGGHIRTLEMLRHLHRWHEIHYLALEKPEES